MGYGVVILVIIIMTLASIIGIKRINAKLNAIVNINQDEIQFVVDMTSAVQVRAISIRNIALLSSAQEINDEMSRFNAQNKAYISNKESLSHYFNTIPTTSAFEKALLTEINGHEKQTMAAIDKTIDQAKNGNPGLVIQTLMKEVRPLQEAWLTSLKKLSDYEYQQNDKAEKESASIYNNVLGTMIIMAIISLIVAIVFSRYITQNILRQLGGEPDTARQLTSAIANGNLSQEIKLAPNDTHSVMYSLKEMQDKLKMVVADIKQSAESISVASDEIAQGNTELSSRTEQQAAALQETAASMEQLTSTVKMNTDNAKEATTNAHQTSDKSKVGGEAVRKMIGTMADISESSNKVSEIISVIESIAFQTNILALNAAVEAARAGEQGRGFAVVAGEVRNLAQRSAQAAKEIKGLIIESVNLVTTGTQVAEKTGAMIEDIINSINGVSSVMKEISLASGEQTQGIMQVNVAVSQMEGVTQQNAALVEEATSATQSLADQAKDLRQAVERFQV